eukprot:TRINITY_DN15333_c1_g1_i1.p1 TRINITY_DN15333_c1_g1~~TRINITY_DN15333_c1_g1_i1.p1  ORF type:complete len:282 (+),score=80.47 TRINITY_DN15333_c1_g1_i1:39-884(+)
MYIVVEPQKVQFIVLPCPCWRHANTMRRGDEDGKADRTVNGDAVFCETAGADYDAEQLAAAEAVRVPEEKIPEIANAVQRHKSVEDRLRDALKTAMAEADRLRAELQKAKEAQEVADAELDDVPRQSVEAQEKMRGTPRTRDETAVALELRRVSEESLRDAGEIVTGMQHTKHAKDEKQHVNKSKKKAERKAKEKAECKAREEAERKAKEEAERKAKVAAEHKAKEEAERIAKVEAERNEKERKAKVEAERKIEKRLEAELLAMREKLAAGEKFLKAQGKI